MADDLVFKALADDTRRTLLDALFVRDGQTVMALCERIPEMTRFGVMKHLGVLEAANLVTTRRDGRTKLHFLNPIPIQQLAERWISKYAQPVIAADWHRAQGVECNNGIWDLVGKDDRSPADDEEMLRLAYSSAYHWQRARGTGPVNEARALYMLAKVHLLIGQAARSLHYADACLAQCVQHGLVDFDLAYAHEARARALRDLGREDEGLAEWATAKQVPIVDPEDRDIVEADFTDAPET